ncbi:nuclear transport factor 2 family protein [Mycolicibacterium sp. ND9-15]|uniref:nuclear transport factor 2 family protein n=1 Tax=Mycolicibacterium sp. ND9-15 TaxID=3042320 RepID=UPI002DD8CC68|nr:nuclear transport factor 2 family protein [Mycolicibacterium sp. ND9-15]WSE55792.1 nuclear transport factor 2 family protein [Mycolicibacterium sp. ND9-15]
MSKTFDLGAIFDEHVADEFVAKDLAATMATMTADPFVNHVPTMMGGVGRQAVAEFYGAHFIGHWPDDTEIIPVSRTVGTDKVVDEMIMSFTHDVVMDTFLPGVAPTGRPVRLPVVVVMGFDGEKVAFERIYWDQASLLAQVALIDMTVLPVTGVEQANKVLNKDLPANELLCRG